MKDMWNDHTDSQLIELCNIYEISSVPEVDSTGCLKNRTAVEFHLTMLELSHVYGEQV